MSMKPPQSDPVMSHTRTCPHCKRGTWIRVYVEDDPHCPGSHPPKAETDRPNSEAFEDHETIMAQCLVELRLFPGGASSHQLQTRLRSNPINASRHISRAVVLLALTGLELRGLVTAVPNWADFAAWVWTASPPPRAGDPDALALTYHVQALHAFLDMIDAGHVKNERVWNDKGPWLWSITSEPTHLLYMGWPQAFHTAIRARWDSEGYRSWTDAMPDIHQLIGDAATQALMAANTEDSPHAEPK